MRKLRFVELYLNIASFRYLAGIIKSLGNVGKQFPHLLLALYVILTSFIAHPVRIVYFFPCLNAKQHIVGFGILWIGIVAVISCYEGNGKLLRHLYEHLVYKSLSSVQMILKLQIEIALSEDIQILQRRLLRLICHSSLQKPRYLPCKTGRGAYKPLVIFP